MIWRVLSTVFLVALGSLLAFAYVLFAPNLRPATSKLATTIELTEKIGGSPLGSIVYSSEMNNIVILVFDKNKLEGFMSNNKSFDLDLATSSARISQRVSFQTKATDETLIIQEVYIPNLRSLRNSEMKSARVSL